MGFNLLIAKVVSGQIVQQILADVGLESLGVEFCFLFPLAQSC